MPSTRLATSAAIIRLDNHTRELGDPVIREAFQTLSARLHSLQGDRDELDALEPGDECPVCAGTV